MCIFFRWVLGDLWTREDPPTFVCLNYMCSKKLFFFLNLDFVCFYSVLIRLDYSFLRSGKSIVFHV